MSYQVLWHTDLQTSRYARLPTELQQRHLDWGDKLVGVQQVD
jgi:hypothetical protein